MVVWIFVAFVIYILKKHLRVVSKVTVEQEAHIKSFSYPRGLLGRVHKRYPELNFSDIEQAAEGLRTFFLAYCRSGFCPIAMPSQIVDEIWHEFILSTQAYQQFCEQAFGRFLHHQPAESLTDQVASNQALRRVWYQSCLHEQLDPRAPRRLPLLFAIDAKLSIPDGFHYVVDCGGVRRQAVAQMRQDRTAVGAVQTASGVLYCAADFANTEIFGKDSSSSCGGGSCGGSSDGCSGGCSGGCGGGCGGS